EASPDTFPVVRTSRVLMTIARLRGISAFFILLAVVLATGTAHAQLCLGNRPGKYKVKIDSTPPGATVYIDSKQCPAVGVTPWNGSLNRGEFTIIIEAQ